jgi:hypothetical protein
MICRAGQEICAVPANHDKTTWVSNRTAFTQCPIRPTPLSS